MVKKVLLLAVAISALCVAPFISGCNKGGGGGGGAGGGGQ